MVSEIFSTSFLFSIAIIVILVGGLFAYFNHRFSEQNHKMQSMLGLVSTMAEEMQYFRSKINTRPVSQMPDIDKIQFIPNFLGGNGQILENTVDDLIEVSDSDDDDDDDDDNSNDDDDNSESDNSDNNSELEEDDESIPDLESDLEDLDDLEDLEDLEPDTRKIISIDLGINNNNDNSFVIESEDIGEDIDDKNIKTISLDISIDETNLDDIDLSLKSISIDDNASISTNKDKDDFKKMSLNKLRELVSSKGLVVDSSKLKKNELLKLLGEE